MDILSSLHHIDLGNDAISYKEISNKDIEDYINIIRNELLNNSIRKKFKIHSDTTEVVSQILTSYKEKSLSKESSDIIANRLLSREQIAQEMVDRLKIEIKKGSLVQALFKENNKGYYLVSKIESAEFLEDTNLQRMTGLPYEKKTFKNCLFEFNEEGHISDIFVSDTNSKIATYWTRDFLELDEIKNDEDNTKLVYKVIDAELKGKSKTNSEYIDRKNQLSYYFENEDDFTLPNCLGKVFGENYNKEPKYEEIEKRIVSKIDKLGADTQFGIEKKVVKNLKSQKIPINESIDLILKNGIDSLHTKVKSVRLENGDKAIQILVTDEVFETFSWQS